MEGVGFFFEFFFIVTPEKKLILFAILAFYCVILFLRFTVKAFFIKKILKNNWRFVV
jgi:hypothetical protein